MTRTLILTRDAAKAMPQPGAIVVLSGAGEPSLAGTAYIGRDIPRVLGNLQGAVPSTARDLLSIAMAVTAADTFVNREREATDGWCRVFRLVVPVEQPAICESVRPLLEPMLHFLSGDMWTLEFVEEAKSEIVPVKAALPLEDASCAALFSGGLDSAIGALDMLAEGATPLLVSHAYVKDASKQEAILPRLPSAAMRLAFNADPHNPAGGRDDSMRTRSFNFIAVGAAAAAAIAEVQGKAVVDLLVPENGFIALNAPLTRRRLGSHSTRTTHPNFLASYQQILDGLGIRARIANPYRAKTKGEMMLECHDPGRLATIAGMTVSCGKWKRRNRQCGRCLPCVIRRAAFLRSGVQDGTDYETRDLKKAMAHTGHRDDVLAMCLACRRPDEEYPEWASQSGPLPEDAAEYEDWIGVAKRGMGEIRSFLGQQGLV